MPDRAEIDRLVTEHDNRLRVRKYLMDVYGPTRTLPWDIKGEVAAYGVSSEEAARAYADAEDVMYGNPARVEVRESVGWVVVVDLRPQIARTRHWMEEENHA
jgi:hypothetical protein